VLNQVPPDEQLEVGSQKLGSVSAASLSRRVRRSTSALACSEAERKVRDGGRARRA
jgi:hypothetical protein